MIKAKYLDMKNKYLLFKVQKQNYINCLIDNFQCINHYFLIRIIKTGHYRLQSLQVTVT